MDGTLLTASSHPTHQDVNTVEFLESVAEKYSSNALVFYELYNEPFLGWEGGGKVFRPQLLTFQHPPTPLDILSPTRPTPPTTQAMTCTGRGSTAERRAA